MGRKGRTRGVEGGRGRGWKEEMGWRRSLVENDELAFASLLPLPSSFRRPCSECRRQSGRVIKKWKCRRKLLTLKTSRHLSGGTGGRDATYIIAQCSRNLSARDRQQGEARRGEKKRGHVFPLPLFAPREANSVRLKTPRKHESSCPPRTESRSRLYWIYSRERKFGDVRRRTE